VNPMILVVGGAGYIGTHMVRDLLDQGYEVLVLDDLSRGHRDLLPGGTFIEGNLGDDRLLDDLFSRWKIQAVMHFAAFSLVGESVEKPLDYYLNNVAATVRLLKAMVRHGVEYFIFSSSAAVYGEPSEMPIREDHPCRPTNPYGTTKLTVERILSDCRRAYGLKYASLRYFNAAGAHPSAQIGERHDPETHLIPLVLKTALGRRKHIKIFGTDYPTEDGTCIRDYIHVNDLTRAHILAMDALVGGAGSAIYNLGNSKGYSVLEVIEAARRVTGKAIPVQEEGRRAGDPAVLIADSGKLREELGWSPQFEDLEPIIETAWAWHRRETGLGLGIMEEKTKKKRR